MSIPQKKGEGDKKKFKLSENVYVHIEMQGRDIIPSIVVENST